MQNLLVLFLITIVLLASWGCKNYRVVDSNKSNLPITNTMPTDLTVVKIISHYKETIDSAMNNRIGTASSMLKIGSREGTLGNFCSDLAYIQGERWHTKRFGNSDQIDFAILNNGGLRAPIDSGEISVRNIYHLMPFENQIVIVEISGDKMMELLLYIQKKTTQQGRRSGVPVSRQLRIQLDSTNHEFTCLIKNKPFEENKTYKIVTSDYLAQGGDEMNFFYNPIQILETGIKLRDAFISLIREKDKKGIIIKPLLDKRIMYVP